MFLKTNDDIIFNTDQITRAQMTKNGNLVILFSDDDNVLKITGDEAQRIWQALSALCENDSDPIPIQGGDDSKEAPVVGGYRNQLLVR